MKILVAIKRVIDYKAVIRIKSDETGVETANVKMSMNPFDEIAVEEAIRIKEKGIANEIIVLSMGPEAAQETIRTALAMGADKGVLIKCSHEISPLNTAKIIKKFVEKEDVKLVLAGKQAIDTDNNQMGQMLAALLGWPQATFASKVEFHDQTVNVTREIDGGLMTVSLQLPTVITTDLRLNQPRYISLPNIVQAKRKPIEILSLESLNMNVDSNIKTIKVNQPIKRSRGMIVKSVAELVSHLKGEQLA